MHRISGRLAFIASLPVAYHCLWSLGFQDTDTRVLVHSLAGCAVYGAFAAKVLIVRSKRLPGVALPIAGGADVRHAHRRLVHERAVVRARERLPRALMLPTIDKVVAIGSWLVAAALAVMLFAGPVIVAEDEGPAAEPAAAGTSPYKAGADPKALFTENCGACHTLEAAGTTGTTGPSLDGDYSAQAVEDAMVAGPGIMPEFGEELSAADRTAIAEFVAAAD